MKAATTWTRLHVAVAWGAVLFAAGAVFRAPAGLVDELAVVGFIFGWFGTWSWLRQALARDLVNPEHQELTKVSWQEASRRRIAGNRMAVYGAEILSWWKPNGPGQQRTRDRFRNALADWPLSLEDIAEAIATEEDKDHE